MISRDCFFSRTYPPFRFAVFARLFVFNDLAPLFVSHDPSLSLIPQARSRGRRRSAARLVRGFLKNNNETPAGLSRNCRFLSRTLLAPLATGS
jgi:hypothetical protein